MYGKNRKVEQCTIKKHELNVKGKNSNRAMPDSRKTHLSRKCLIVTHENKNRIEASKKNCSGKNTSSKVMPILKTS